MCISHHIVLYHIVDQQPAEKCQCRAVQVYQCNLIHCTHSFIRGTLFLEISHMILHLQNISRKPFRPCAYHVYDAGLCILSYVVQYTLGIEVRNIIC